MAQHQIAITFLSVWTLGRYPITTEGIVEEPEHRLCQPARHEEMGSVELRSGDLQGGCS